MAMARKTSTNGAGTKSGTAKKALVVRPVRRADVRLPSLAPFEGGALESEGDYDGIEFRDLDLVGQEGRGARFMDCGLYGVALDETRLSRARIMDSVLDGVRGVGTDLAEASLRDVELIDARLGGVQLHASVLERVLVRGGKIDYLNLRTARLKDVVFESCVLVEPDFGGARLERVEFRDCVIRRADFSAATLLDVDLRTVAELDIARGLDRLTGSVISPSQLLDLAPAFAAQMGVKVASPGA
ncbi:pentapeptide repeat-containing protein [Streptomyces sp. A5-4]|uniref:pentapeptide repeat-containing protein n=1 Tax=Streptomyces sp. A5-4 TaxID=3384771 RepID=UPI003DA96708